MDVTDPQTGVNAKTATASVREMAQRLEPTEPWCCVKAKLYAYLCDNLAIGMSEHDWFPAFAVWNRYARPVSPVVGRRNQKIFARYNADEQARMNAGNASGKWTFWRTSTFSAGMGKESRPRLSRHGPSPTGQLA